MRCTARSNKLALHLPSLYIWISLALVSCSNQEVIVEKWENGQVKESRLYARDSGQYVVKLYYENGQLKETGLFLRRSKLLKDGDWKTYYPNGTMKSYFQYTNGEKVGRWIHYYRNGNILEISHYDAGRLHGPYKFYDSLGAIVEQGEYFHNKRAGEWTPPSESFEDDRDMEKDIYLPDGSLKKGVESLADGRQKVTFFQNGVLTKMGYLKNDEPDSLWIFYDQRRQKKKEVIYRHSKMLLLNHWDDNGVQNVKDGNGSILVYGRENVEALESAVLMEHIYEDGLVKTKRRVSK